MIYVKKIIKNQDYGKKNSRIERVLTRKGVGNGGEQLRLQSETLCCGYPGHASDASTKPLSAD